MMSNIVVSLSGYPGSGKTTIGNEIVKNNKNFVYFDFGKLFRSLAYYLLKELELEYDEIQCLVDNNKIFDFITISYKICDNKVEIGVNGNFYGDEKLNNLFMDDSTVIVGGIIGDIFNNNLSHIIDEIKTSSNVLLNARKPFVVYPMLDEHIFLTCDFYERARRKSELNNVTMKCAMINLESRDFIEEKNGFFETYSFTKMINTTNISVQDVYNSVMSEIRKNVNYDDLNNLTLILGSYDCNKNCPYCIAKNNLKFKTNDKLDSLELILSDLANNNIKFKRFFISGNGEPSKYEFSDLEKILIGLRKNLTLFSELRIHTSGNLFLCEDKFNLFNEFSDTVEFEVLRVAFDSKIDMKVLNYSDNYLDSLLFKKSKNVKCDIALTDYLETNCIFNIITDFLKKNSSIKKVRLKKLMLGDNDDSKQANWVRKHTLCDADIMKILNDLNMKKKANNIYESPDGMIIYKTSGNFDRDIVINNGEYFDYNNNKYTVKTLKKEYDLNA